MADKRQVAVVISCIYTQPACQLYVLYHSCVSVHWRDPTLNVDHTQAVSLQAWNETMHTLTWKLECKVLVSV